MTRKRKRHSPNALLGLLYPLAQIFQHLHQLPLPALRLRPQLTHVLPPRHLRETHQDALDPRPRRHQPKPHPAVVHQVELNIPPAADELPPPLVLRARGPVAALEDREVRRHERVTRRFDEREDLVRGLWAGGVGGEPLVGLAREIVEKDPADTARLAAVRDVEILAALPAP